MVDEFDGTDTEWEALETPLRGIDSDLNIFALANGLDLLRNVSGTPDRTLEWYREGMERRIRVRAEEPDRYVVRVGASRKRDGAVEEAWREFTGPFPAADLRAGLRPRLSEAIDRANELGPDDLRPVTG